MKSTTEDIAKIVSTGDAFKISIVGFSAIEDVLEELITEALPREHKLELSRLSAGFKVDLAIGLGVFDNSYRNITLKLSKIRNIFAHEFDMASTPYDSEDVLSAMPQEQRDKIAISKDDENYKVALLSVATLYTYIDIYSRIKWFRQKRRQKIEDVAHMRALLDVIPEPDESKSDYRKNYEFELDKRIAKRKSEILEEIKEKKGGGDK